MKKYKAAAFVDRSFNFYDGAQLHRAEPEARPSAVHAPLPALDYSPDSMTYEMVDAINSRFAPRPGEVVSRHVFGE